MLPRPPSTTLFPYTTLFRSLKAHPSTAANDALPEIEQLWESEARLASLKERSEEHTSELQSLRHLVCRLLLEKKKKYSARVNIIHHHHPQRIATTQPNTETK